MLSEHCLPFGREVIQVSMQPFEIDVIGLDDMLFGG